MPAPSLAKPAAGGPTAVGTVAVPQTRGLYAVPCRARRPT